MAKFGILQDQPGNALKGHVGFGLVRPDRDGPAVLLGQHGLVIPVCALDQPDGNREIALASPGQEVAHVVLGATQVSLKHDAKMRIIRILGAQPLVQFDGGVLVLELFHVDAHEPAHLHYLLIDGFDAGHHAFDRTVHIHGLGLGIERGRLDGNIDLGRMAPVKVALAVAQGLPLAKLLLDGIEHFQVAFAVGVGFHFGHGGFAQQIEDKTEAVLAQLLDALDRLLGHLPDDELAGHGFDVGTDGLVQDLGDQSAAYFGLGGPPFEDVRDVGIVACEIFFDMAGKRLGCVEVRKNINESEHLDLEILVFHGPIHDLSGPPALVENRRRFACDGRKKLPAPSNDSRVQGASVSSHSLLLLFVVPGQWYDPGFLHRGQHDG